MSYDSYRNKHLLQFDDGKLMLIAEVSCNNVRDWKGRRVWDWVLFHPEGSLFYTKETLKTRSKEYVEEQLQLMRDFSRHEVETGWAKEYVEPTVNSDNYYGTRWPSGKKIKDGRAFFGGRPTSAEEFVSVWGNPERITFETCDKDWKTIAKETYNIMRKDIDSLYAEFVEANGKCYIGIN
jgi:hypothetical protein